MSASQRATRSASTSTASRRRSQAQTGVGRIAVGVDDYEEGRDAVVLGAAIADVTEARLLLVTVHSAPVLPHPQWNWRNLRKHAEGHLRELRNEYAPEARITTRTSSSVPRALQRVIEREGYDLLVMGSSRDASDGHVRIGKRTRQLLCHFGCALAIAPRGMHAKPDVQLRRIGVGYDDEPESDAALALAGSIATAAGAELVVTAVVDDRVPVLLRSALGGFAQTEWHDAIAEEEERLHAQGLAAAEDIGVPVDMKVLRGRPADGLLTLSNEVDLLVIGSRHWGPAARVLLGTTGEALMHDAGCPVLAVPRP